MSNPLHAKYYADEGCHKVVRVDRREELARDTHLLRLDCPEIAQRIRPGQFLMMRVPGRDDPLLGRAFAMYDVVVDDRGKPRFVDVVFHVIGKMTSLLSEMRAGDDVAVWGPLGNGFDPQPVEHLILVAGGIGQTPFLALAKEYVGRQQFGPPGRQTFRAERVTLCYGVRNRDYLAGVADFRALGVDVRVATDDGSAGHHGLVTELLAQTVADTELQVRVECCGPEPMMEAIAAFTGQHGLSCRVSLETPMACGLGICFSCVARVRMPDGSWDYKRTCVDGPVFPADAIVW